MRAAKVDANHAEIVKALRSLGASVQSLASVGKGCPDIVVGFRGRNYLFEIKDGAKPPSARQLTACEADWHYFWSGQVEIVTSAGDAITKLLALDVKK